MKKKEGKGRGGEGKIKKKCKRGESGRCRHGGVVRKLQVTLDLFGGGGNGIFQRNWRRGME